MLYSLLLPLDQSPSQELWQVDPDPDDVHEHEREADAALRAEAVLVARLPEAVGGQRHHQQVGRREGDQRHRQQVRV